MITFRHLGDFRRTETFLSQVRNNKRLALLHKYGQEGVRALASGTPVDSGKTAGSWTYDIVQTQKSTSVYWSNTNINDGANVAILLQYGHGTGSGGYVEGIDYINPAMRPVFDRLAQEAWKEVTSV